jgi:hypothetical protein
MQAFVQLRHIAVEHSELKLAIEELRKQTEERFKIIFTELDNLFSESDS